MNPREEYELLKAMTPEEFEAFVEGEGEVVRAGDVEAYRWRLPCYVYDGHPFLNEIVVRIVFDDGRICLGLDTHNTCICQPDDELVLLPVNR